MRKERAQPQPTRVGRRGRSSGRPASPRVRMDGHKAAPSGPVSIDGGKHAHALRANARDRAAHSNQHAAMRTAAEHPAAATPHAAVAGQQVVAAEFEAQRATRAWRPEGAQPRRQPTSHQATCAAASRPMPIKVSRPKRAMPGLPTTHAIC